jgi:hypothetical protein
MKTIEAVDVRHFKLTNGENIICYVQSTTEHAFIVERPAAVQASPAGIWGFADWFPFSDKKVYKLMKRFVINHTEVVTETKESYIKYSCHDEIKDISYDTDDYPDMEYDTYDIDTSDKKTVH